LSGVPARSHDQRDRNGIREETRLSTASTGRPGGPVDPDDGDVGTSEPAMASIPGSFEDAGRAAGNDAGRAAEDEGCEQDEPSCEPEDDDEYEPL
jgi:hypothetical protein